MPIQNILAIDVSTAVLAIGPLFFILIPQPSREAAMGGLPSVLTDLMEGFRFIWNWKGLMMIVSMALVINLLTNPAFSLLPILVTSYFMGGAIQLAWLQSAIGVGMILGGILLSVWGGFKSRIRTAMFALIIMGISFLVFWLTPGSVFLLAVGTIFVFGVMNSIANASFFAILQATVPAEIQGRVFTLMMSLIMSMTPVGLALAGPIADLLGVRIWYLVAGFVMAIIGIGANFVSTIMQFEEEPP